VQNDGQAAIVRLNSMRSMRKKTKFASAVSFRFVPSPKPGFVPAARPHALIPPLGAAGCPANPEGNAFLLTRKKAKNFVIS
jgi:hypothetical protein